MEIKHEHRIIRAGASIVLAIGLVAAVGEQHTQHSTQLEAGPIAVTPTPLDWPVTPAPEMLDSEAPTTTTEPIPADLERTTDSKVSRSYNRPTPLVTEKAQPPATKESTNSSGRSIGTFVVTCYALTGRTASGTQAGPGSIAADWRVVPKGTHLQMDGYEGTVVDTGGDIKGNRLDIHKSSAAACNAWGRRKLEVFITSGGSIYTDLSTSERPPSPTTTTQPETVETTTTTQPPEEPTTTTTADPQTQL